MEIPFCGGVPDDQFVRELLFFDVLESPIEKQIALHKLALGLALRIGQEAVEGFLGELDGIALRGQGKSRAKSPEAEAPEANSDRAGPLRGELRRGRQQGDLEGKQCQRCF